MTGGPNKRLEWSERSLLQLAAQFEYVIANRLAPPETVRQRLERTLTLLQRHPRIGSPGRRSGTRELLVKDTPLTLIYRDRPGRIQILAVVHQRQFFG